MRDADVIKIFMRREGGNFLRVVEPAENDFVDETHRVQVANLPAFVNET